MDSIARILATAAACALLASCATTQRPQWKADLSCRGGGVAALNVPVTVRTERSEFFLERGAPGDIGRVMLRGFPDPDDRLVLSGEIVPLTQRVEQASLEGRRDGSGYLLSGRVGPQNCTIAMRLE